jgi:hypothetical protein
VGELHLATDGDGNERAYWPSIYEQFPNYERFWRYLVVPTTKRIDLPLGSENRHHRREGIAEDLWRITYINYSLFLNLAYASDHLRFPRNSSFANFYTHLGSVCDLAQKFPLRGVCSDLLVPWPAGPV